MTQEQHHWVNHWNQTQHSLNSIWVVKTKERRHTKVSINKSLFSLYLHINRQQDWRKRSNVIEWNIKIKHNTQWTLSGLWRQKKEYTQKTSINNSLIPFLFTSTDNNIGERGATSLSESLKSNTTLTELILWGEDKRKKTHKRNPSTIHYSSFLNTSTGNNINDKLEEVISNALQRNGYEIMKRELEACSEWWSESLVFVLHQFVSFSFSCLKLIAVKQK